MKSIRATQIIEVGFTVVCIWLALESAGRREWLSAVIFFLMALTFAHSVWSDLRNGPKSRGTA
jgi:hypothetical protein